MMENGWRTTTSLLEFGGPYGGVSTTRMVLLSSTYDPQRLCGVEESFGLLSFGSMWKPSTLKWIAYLVGNGLSCGKGVRVLYTYRARAADHFFFLIVNVGIGHI